MFATTETPTDPQAIRPSAKRLSVYLNDHLAGSTVGVELARRASKENTGTPLGDWLQELSRQLDEDRAILVRLMDHLGVRRNHIEVAAAWTAEKVGRLKLNGQLTGYSPLSPLIELEALHLAVTANVDLWKALRHSVAERLRDIDIDVDERVRRAEGQAQELERHRLDVAAKALADAG